MRSARLEVAPIAQFATGSRMPTALIMLLRAIGLICRGHRAVALANLALHQQLAALARSGARPRLLPRHRRSWIVLAKSSQDWPRALVFAQPDTVIRWHREWLRRGWAARSQPKHGGPTVDKSIRTLV